MWSWSAIAKKLGDVEALVELALSFARGASGVVPRASWLVPNWYVDPVHGKDTNSGESPSFPVMTIMGGIVPKWGTQSPQLKQTTTIHMLGSETVGQESIVLTPQLAGGVNFIIDGQLTLVGVTFSPTGVTPKNRNTPQLLELTGAPAGAVAGTLVHNVTKDSYAWIDVVAGTTWTMTQPFTATSLLNVSASTTPIEDDTWASGDTYQRYSASTLNIVYLQATGGQTNSTSGFEDPVLWVQNCYVPDLTGEAGFSLTTASCQAGVLAVFAQCSFQTFLVGEGAGGASLPGACLSCWLSAGYWVSTWDIVGGAGNTDGASFFAACYFNEFSAIDGDAIIHGGVFNHGGLNCFLGLVYLDASTTEISGHVRIEPEYYSNAIVWGPGTIDVNGGGTLANESGTTWVDCLLVTGGLHLDSAATGTRYAAGVWTDGVAITPANLDADLALQNPNVGSRYSSV